jgi:hypothetical protein
MLKSQTLTESKSRGDPIESSLWSGWNAGPFEGSQLKRRIYDGEARLLSEIHPHHTTDHSVRRLLSVDFAHERNKRIHGEPLRQNFFRTGHAHAGVIVILSLVCQILADSAILPSALVCLCRILISAGFFFSLLPPPRHGAEPSSQTNLCRRCYSRHLSTHAGGRLNPNFSLHIEVRLNYPEMVVKETDLRSGRSG